jgi:competence ComEA-like helix-hairpin-helix protein
MLRGRRDNRRGIVLIVTLWVLMILAVLVITFAGTMHVEARAAANEMERTKALYAAKAGVQRAILAINQDTTGYASPLSEWAYLDSEEEFTFPDDEAYEVTVTDECGKLNVNSADENLLAKIPELTPEMIDSIIDWRDADDEARPEGAELEYYSRQQPPRVAANRPFLTLPELLLVRGITKDAFYGDRAQRPTTVEAPSDQASTDQQVVPLADLLTVYGGASDTDSQGQERLNINAADAEELADRTSGILSDADVQEIVDHRNNSGAFDSIGDLLGVPGMTREKMQQIADLITTKSQPSGSGGQSGGSTEQPSPEQSPFPTPSIPGLEGETPQQFSPPGDQLPSFPSPGSGGTGEQTPQSGGAESAIDISSLPTADEYQPNIFNLNTAPAEVLATIDGMTDQALKAILQYREQQPFITRGDLLALPEITEVLFTQLVEKVTVRSSTLRITSIGSVEAGRVRVQVTAVVSLQSAEPQIVYLAEG